MSKRNKREHGRILSVETMARGSALDVDAAAAATSITVTDAGDFDEDGGWLTVGGQVVEFTDVDDDNGTITLATPLAAAAEQGDPVHVWSTLYEETVDYQVALVQLDGEYDNPDPVVAEVAEGVWDLPEGDRGRAGESCTLLRVADDEWEVVGVGGRSRKSRGVRFEQDDTYTLSVDDITAGSATLSLSHRPIDEALTCVLAGVPQRPTEWTVDHDAQSLTMPLDGWEQAGDVLWVHYAYRKGVTTPTIAPDPPVVIQLADTVAVADSGMGGGEGSVVGTPPVWKDGSDATYAEFAGSYFGEGNPQFVGWAQASFLSSTPALSSVAEVKVVLRLSAVGAGQAFPVVRLERSGSTPALSLQPTGVAPTAATEVEYVLQETAGGALDDFRGQPANYICYVKAPGYPAGSIPGAAQRWRVYEARIEVTL